LEIKISRKMNTYKQISIAILCGGWSKEREISLLSGTTTYNCLKDNGYNVLFLDMKENDKKVLSNFIEKNSIELVFNLIHGTGGEDGLIQSYLDELEVQYVGSNSKSSRESFDKIITKKLWRKNGLQTPDYQILGKETDYEDIINKLGNNFIVKPIKSGSSVDIEIIKSQSQYNNYIESKKNLNDYFGETLVQGDEYTAPVISEEIFPIIQIETKREFYDYHAKYIDENTTFTFPSFEKEFLEYIHSIVKEAFCVIGCTGWGRVDFFINNNKEIELIEINSIPGMTNHSLVPMSAEKNDLDFIKLLEKILFNS
tara:strand:- start:4457 stop:5395 length:939 start_codon:yes stop_codon:yes gene_type:complete